GRLGSAAPPRARGLAREVRRPVRPPLHASSAPADGQRVARRRRPARRGGVPRDRRPPPAGPLRALGPRSPGLRSRAPRRALLEHAVDLRAVPAGERVLRARQPAARYALAHARARRRHRLRHRVARRGGPRGGCGMIRRLALWLAAALTAAGANADPAAWRATAPSGEELWLLGSMHYLRASDYPLPAPIDALIDGADTIVMELDLDDIDPIAQQRTLLGAALLPPGTVLADVLGAERHAALAERAAALGVDLALLERFEPWLVAIMLLDQSMVRHGYR